MRPKRNTPEEKRAWADYMKAWRDRNHERVLPVERERYRKNGDRWRKANRGRVNEKRNARYHTDPEFRARTIEQAQANYRRVRTAIIAAYGAKCSCCGESHPLFLELDHVNGGGNKDFKAHKSPVNLYREVIEAGFPDSFRLLCANCNKGRQRNGGICPHQMPNKL